MKLRPYQSASLDALFSFWQRSNGNALITLPTGCGKSFVIAELCRRVLAIDPNAKIINAINVRELVRQNHDELRGIAPELHLGIYSAGLNQKKKNASVTFANIQSIWKKAFAFPAIDILVADECHRISKKDSGMWKSFIDDLLVANPHMRCIGLTATDYRMTEGSLVEGDGALFEEVVYKYSIVDAIDQGYLCKITTRPTETHLDISGVKKRGGEFVESELQKAVNVDEITQACVREIMKLGGTRKSWLVFASGVDHALAVRDAIRSHGVTCETVSAKTPKEERDKIIQDHKDGKITCITNNSVLCEGYNNPKIDLVILMRPTGSPGLYVQMVGRGTRIAEGKENCLILDFGGNIERHGFIDKIKVKDKRTSGDGTAPSKLCPLCFALCPASVMVCADCGHVFPGSEGPDLNRRASTDALLSNQIVPVTYQVKMVSYFKHQKEGKPPTLRVDYLCGLKRFSEWVALESPKARHKAAQWWSRFGGLIPAPSTVDEALTRQKELFAPLEIIIRKEGQYDRVYHTNTLRHIPVTAQENPQYGMGG